MDPQQASQLNTILNTLLVSRRRQSGGRKIRLVAVLKDRSQAFG